MYKKILILCPIIFLAISDGLIVMSDSEMGVQNSTYITASLKYVTLFIILFFAYKSWWSEIPFNIRFFYKLLLFWNFFTISKGIVLAEGYWDWKYLLLSTALFFLIPLAFFIGNNLILARSTILYILKYLFIPGLLLIPLSLKLDIELYARVMLPVSFLIIFIPYLKFRWTLLILLVAIVSILVALTFRTNMLKIVLSLIIIFTYYFKILINRRFLKLIFVILFIAPIFFLLAGLISNYNVFRFLSAKDNFTYATSTGKIENLTSDTRTFLYQEVFSSFESTTQLVIGKGAAGRYKSSFDYLGVDNKGRGGSEVGFLNIILFSGIFGAIIYCIFILICSYTAIFKSNNWLCKMLGLFILSRWMTFFIEDYTQFNLNFYCLWIAFGLTSSEFFRSMDDLDIKDFFDFNMNFYE